MSRVMRAVRGNAGPQDQASPTHSYKVGVLILLQARALAPPTAAVAQSDHVAVAKVHSLSNL